MFNAGIAFYGKFLFTDENTLTSESEMSKVKYVYLHIPKQKYLQYMIYNIILINSSYSISHTNKNLQLSLKIIVTTNWRNDAQKYKIMLTFKIVIHRVVLCIIYNVPSLKNRRLGDL